MIIDTEKLREAYEAHFAKVGENADWHKLNRLSDEEYRMNEVMKSVEAIAEQFQIN